MEADICGEVDNKVHLIDTKQTGPPVLNVTALIHQHPSGKRGQFDAQQVYLVANKAAVLLSFPLFMVICDD